MAKRRPVRSARRNAWRMEGGPWQQYCDENIPSEHRLPMSERFRVSCFRYREVHAGTENASPKHFHGQFRRNASRLRTGKKYPSGWRSENERQQRAVLFDNGRIKMTLGGFWLGGFFK